MNKTSPLSPTGKAHLIIAPQSAGRIGKSTAAEAIVTWAKFAKIEFVVLDLDAEHRTISQRYPGESTAFPEGAASDDGFMGMLNAVCEAPVPLIVADFPAQATDHILRQLTDRNGLEILDAAGITVTCLIFPAEDTAARQSAVKCVSALGDRVKWLVIRQPGPKALIDEAAWAESAIGRKLAEYGAGEVTFPRMSTSTREAHEEASKAEGRWLSFDEARAKVRLTARFEIDLWRNAALMGCEDNAAFLIPDVSLIQNRTERPKAPPRSKAAIGGLGLDL